MRNILFFGIAVMIVATGYAQQKPLKTIENLKAGIKGETTASAKYTAFAQKARQEGKTNIAILFEAASKAESIHAANHTKVLESLGEKMEAFTPAFDVKTTKENLQAAIDGESYEASVMYPQFLADASAEKVEKATKSFTWAFDTEKKHKEFYSKALVALMSNAEKSLPVHYVVCPVCGNTYDGNKVDEFCTFCGTSKTKFIMIM
jgi:rubrerythrin